ncbi:MAG: hypothetical protein JXA57_14205 [Armatimonadetes bacterium]|nr:hypothetical protein [Armatimonadota bacterium]
MRVQRGPRAAKMAVKGVLVAVVPLFSCTRQGSTDVGKRGEHHGGMLAGEATGTRQTHAGGEWHDLVRRIAGADESLIFYFKDNSCPECSIVQNEVIVPCSERYGLFGCELVEIDVTAAGMARAVLALETELGFRTSRLAPLVVWNKRPFVTVNEIRRFFVEEECGLQLSADPGG